jgi:Ca-activated chloride channel family protein
MCTAAFSAAIAVTSSTPAAASGLLIADGGLGGVLEIKDHDVRVTINNGVAVTEVEQVFVNTENRIVEALYTFPVPKGASVSNFSMWIGGKEMIGEVVEKERARQIYNSYKQIRRDPGLLEQVDYKRFEMRIFPIAAGAEQRVRLTYYQELDVDHDWATYVYPLATATRPGMDQTTKGRFSVTVDVKSEVPIVDLKSSSHATDFAVAKHNLDYWRASLETTAGSLARDVVLAYHVERPRTGVDVITSRAVGDDGFLQLTITAGKELEELNQGMDYVFVLDVSGSMAHDGKLPLSRQSLSSFIESLGPSDRFELMAFNISPTTLFNELRPASAEQLAEATNFLATRRAQGGTILRPALETAYRYRTADRPLNVVVLSDGMTEQSEQTELIRLIQERPAGCRVFCIGVGNEVNRPLLTQLANDAGGLAAFISQGDDFDRQAQAFRRKLMRPAINNLQLSFDDGEVFDVEPAVLPDLFHGAPQRIYARYRGEGSTRVTFKGEVQGAPFEQAVTIRLPKSDDTNPEIERMWASRRVDRLLAEARQAGNSAAVADEVVALCEDFSIVSEFASFIVLENDAEYQRWKIERRNLSRLERDRASQTQRQESLARAREKAVANLGPQATPPQVMAAPAPQNTAQSVPAPSPSTPPAPQSSSQPENGFDLDLPGGSGGGAIDPLSAAIGLGLAAAAAARARRARKKSDSGKEI